MSRLLERLHAVADKLSISSTIFLVVSMVRATQSLAVAAPGSRIRVREGHHRGRSFSINAVQFATAPRHLPLP